jgi:outer membrane lipoprotein
MKQITLVLLIALTTACASKPPHSISKVPHENPTLTRVRMDIDRYIGSEVRWGGVISKVENKADRTWIEVVRHELRDNGRPISSSRSDGRFIASFEKFADPLVYEEGRPLTVVGTIEAKTNRPIGEYDYLFPVVTVEGSFLWKKHEPVPAGYYYPPPYWYYDPWYHHPWPYRHHRHYH